MNNKLLSGMFFQYQFKVREISERSLYLPEIIHYFVEGYQLSFLEDVGRVSAEPLEIHISAFHTSA